MAMYVFQELSPKVFYFTYCLQEIGNYIKFIEETESNQSKHNLISKWKPTEWGSEKSFSSDFSNEQKPIDGRTLFLVNNLKATFHHCFSQYKLFNNIEEDVNLETTYSIQKFNENNFDNTLISHGKYTARLYINNSFDGGEVIVSGRPAFKPEAGSIIISPSQFKVDHNPALNNSRYIAKGYWV